MKPFSRDHAIAILVYKQISSNSFENRIIDKLLIYKSYIYHIYQPLRSGRI